MQKQRANRAVRGLIGLVVLVVLALASCGPAEDVIYLNLMWHQHQPQYYPDPDTGIVTRPWVRMHSQKSYYDMAATVAQYPELRATFNLTPVLLEQIDDYLDGARDIYWTLAETPASELTDDEKRFILTRFFDANWTNIVGKYPRYRELLTLRGESADSAAITAAMERYTEQDFRDLQVWFNLAWFDPSFLAEEPLASLVAQGRDYREDQKSVMFDEALRIMGEVVAIHRELQDSGQIEVTTTPYAHPILPLIYNSDIIAVNDPSGEVPPRYSYPNDVQVHLQRAAERYQEDYGRPVRGMWPAEGSVSQDIVRFVADAGFTWMASGEQTLARSLGIDGFTRNEDDVIEQPDLLYRPYYVNGRDGQQVAIVFRDLRISDLIGFEYSGTPPQEAVNDFIGRIEDIKATLDESGAEGPHLVSVILDGENAWENYPNDGLAFLNGLYQDLAEHETIRTITPSEYLERFPEQRSIEDLWPGSWFSPDFATWIGETEERVAWEYLERVRRHLARYDITGREQATEEQLANALEAMYLAEGSDWFWWYGADQDSGVDEYFDEGFRALLRQVYVALGDEVPDFIDVPIIPDRPAPATRGASGPVTPTIDGAVAPGEWDNAGYAEFRGGVQAALQGILSGYYTGYNTEGFVFRADGRSDWADTGVEAVEVYFAIPGQENSVPRTLSGTVLGFRAGYALVIPQGGEALLYTANRFGEWSGTPSEVPGAFGRRIAEGRVPLEALPEIQPGDSLDSKVVVTARGRDLAFLPQEGLSRVVIPDLGNTEVLGTIVDASGDDHGPGSYRYPTDSVFLPGSYDIEQLTIARNERNAIFEFQLGSEIQNPWGSGINLSVQTLDIYIDVDPGAGTGASELLDGRDASLTEGAGWDLAVWIEGWNQKLFVPNEEGRASELSGSPVRVVVDGSAGTVTILVPREVMADSLGIPLEELDLASYGYTAAVLSQEGFPSPGVLRVRDVQEGDSQWRIGGGTGAEDDTRIMDLVVPDDGGASQEALLSANEARSITLR